jgi:hypothetical protein
MRRDRDSSLPPGIDTGGARPIPRLERPMSTFEPQPARGTGLLLAHCAFLGERPSAQMRLEAELGDEFARLLVAALATPQGRRGSSSP